MKPLPCHTSIVQTSFPLEDDIEACLQYFNVTHIHDDIVGVLKKVAPPTRNFKLPRYLMLQYTGESKIGHLRLAIYKNQDTQLANRTSIMENLRTLGKSFDLKLVYFCL